MGGWAEGLAWIDPGARTRIGASESFTFGVCLGRILLLSSHNSWYVLSPECIGSWQFLLWRLLVCLQGKLAIILIHHFLHEPPDLLSPLDATQSPSWQPPLDVGFDFCTELLIVLRPISTLLNVNPNWASVLAISLNICRSSQFWVGGMIIGAQY